MGLLSGYLALDVIAALVTVSIAVFTYFEWAFTYWKRRNVPYLEPSIPFGTADNPFVRSEYIGFRIKRLYDKIKARGHKHGGMYIFTAPIYMPIDPEYIKNIMSRDFRHFTDRGTYFNERDDPLSAHLFSLEGQKWRTLRAKLTPTFTSGKMKMMFPTLVGCGSQLKSALDELLGLNQPVDAKELLSCFTTDVIGSCAFGLECNSFSRPDSEFRRHGKGIFASVTKTSSLGTVIALINSNLARFLRITVTPKDISKFFLGIVNETVEYREKNGVVRKDFMQLLMDLRKDGGDGEESFTVEEMAAQAFAFFLAGFETSSTTMTFCLFELARNPDIQEKMRDEVLHVLEKHEGELTYDAIMDMKYMSQVIDETLRRYPPGSLIPRVCVKDYHVPGTDTVIEKGTRITIPIFALHHDPEFYPDPERFDPDRFSEENKEWRHPFTYMPFGEGPRICIGLRFGLMQTKVGLAVLLKNYSFTVNGRTRIPLEIDPTNLILTSKDGIWLNISKIAK